MGRVWQQKKAFGGLFNQKSVMNSRWWYWKIDCLILQQTNTLIGLWCWKIRLKVGGGKGKRHVFLLKKNAIWNWKNQ